ARNLQRLKIEHERLAQSSVADESAVKLGDYGHSVIAFKITGNGARHGELVRIQHFDFGAVRQVDAAPWAIDRDVVEILAVPGRCAQRNLLEQMVTAFGSSREEVSAQPQNAQSNH